MKNILITLLLSILSLFARSQNTILWKVTDTIHHKTSFIVGSFHQIGNSFIDSIPSIKEYLLHSDLAVFESIDKVEDTRKIIENRLPSNEIEKNLKKKDFIKLKEITKDWKVDIYKLKPIEIYWKLRQEYPRIVCKTVMSTDTFDHFDNYLQYLAEENNIELFGLETNQLDILEKEYENPSWKNERKKIHIWIHKLTNDKRTLENCNFENNYRNFDLDYEFEKECASNYIIQQRNNEWMEIIPHLLSTKNVFVVVGYNHLMWNCSILKQLENLGFKIEPIELKPVVYQVSSDTK